MKQNQELQIGNSQTYDDMLDVLNAEISSTNLESDFNFIRSAIKQITGESDWFSSPSTTIKALGLAINTTKLVTYFRSEYQIITVPNTYNFAALSTVGFAPSENIALEADSIGAIVAELPSVSGANHSLVQAPNESNLLLIRDTTNFSKILDTNGRTIYGLLQVANGSTDGNAFALSGNDSAQISFVSRDPTTGLLQEADIFAIQNKVIQYSFQKREALINIEENAFAQSITFITG